LLLLGVAGGSPASKDGVCDEIRNVRGNWYYKLPPARLMHCTIDILRA